MTTSNWELQPEHELLGAHINPELQIVENYGDLSAELEALKESQAVVDLHGCRMLLVEGSAAEHFMQCAMATQALFVGQNAFSAVFDSDGRLLGCPLVIRTGDHEYLLFDKGIQFENILDWLQALSQAKQAGQLLFNSVSVEEKTGVLYPLALCGPGAKDILNDYLQDTSALQYPGMTTALKLDQIESIASRLALEYPVYFLLVPPTMARILFRSFLSFKELQTAGIQALTEHLAGGECSFLKLFCEPQEGEEAPVFELEVFIKRGLVRQEPTYLGARALLS